MCASFADINSNPKPTHVRYTTLESNRDRLPIMRGFCGGTCYKISYNVPSDMNWKVTVIIELLTPTPIEKFMFNAGHKWINLKHNDNGSISSIYDNKLTTTYRHIGNDWFYFTGCGKHYSLIYDGDFNIDFIFEPYRYKSKVCITPPPELVYVDEI